MQIDQDRIRAILKDKHSYYGYHDIPIRNDHRWKLGWDDYIAPQLSTKMRVLDVGCGNGEFLMDLNANFYYGLGIDNDPEHIKLAEAAKLARGIRNVDFLLLDYPQDIDQLQPESFDLVVSLRGPVPDTTESLQAAFRLLRTDGMIYCDEIAELHQKEIVEIFERSSHEQGMPRKVDEVRAMLEHNGFEVRLAADFFAKWYYPDVYAWAEYISNLWTWLGIPLPEPDDPRIGLFAERNTIVTGEIETTHHVAIVAGVKKRETSAKHCPPRKH